MVGRGAGCRRAHVAASLLPWMFALTACRGAGTPAGPPPPAVTVAHPLVQAVVEWDEYTGRLSAIQSVEV